MEDKIKQSLTANASLYNEQPTNTGSSCPSARLRTLEGRRILIPAVGGNILDYTWPYKQYMTEEHLGSILFHYIDDEVRNNAQYYLQF